MNLIFNNLYDRKNIYNIYFWNTVYNEALRIIWLFHRAINFSRNIQNTVGQKFRKINARFAFIHFYVNHREAAEFLRLQLSNAAQALISPSIARYPPRAEPVSPGKVKI